MSNIFLKTFVSLSVLANCVCREYEVHIQVNDFSELAGIESQINHEIRKRSVGNVSTTAIPSQLVQTTPNVFSKTSFNTTTVQPSLKPTVYVSDKTTADVTNNPHSTSQSLPATPGRHVTTHFPVLTTTPMPINNTNKTNVTIVQDHHKYFTSHYYASGERWWFDLNDGSGEPQLHDDLSKNLQYSDTIKTKFTFTYYGHEINKVTITNKGYLFLGDTLHKFNASTQYVAPLMADFGAHLHNETSIRYVDTGDRFTVEWSNLKLQNRKAQTFSFQCSILKNGTIVFAYKNIPVPVSEIKNDTFPVRVGLSDSFLLIYWTPAIFIKNGKLYFGIRHYVYYQYDKVKLPKEKVTSGSAFVLTPLPNCILFKSCDSCMNSKTKFSCKWCPALQRCSDGIDRHRHSWLVNNCEKNRATKCPHTRPNTRHNSRPSTQSSTPNPNSQPSAIPGRKRANGKTKSSDGSSSNKRAGIAVLVVFCLLILIFIAGWIAYAYTHPLSKSGMFLMQYGNPRKWCGKSESGSSGVGNVTFKTMPDESTA